MEIFNFKPLNEMRFELKNDYKLIGKTYAKAIKYSNKFSYLNISMDFIVDLKKLREIQSFFIKMQGRTNAFFLPSHTKNFTILKDISEGDLAFIAKSEKRNFGNWAQKSYIYVKSKDFITKIIDVSVDEESEIITLQDPMPFIDKEEKIQKIYKVRFLSDELKATKINATKFSLTISFKELQ